MIQKIPLGTCPSCRYTGPMGRFVDGICPMCRQIAFGKICHSCKTLISERDVAHNICPKCGAFVAFDPKQGRLTIPAKTRYCGACGREYPWFTALCPYCKAVNYPVWRNRALGIWLWLASFPVAFVSPGAATVLRVAGTAFIALLAWSTWRTLRDYRQMTPPGETKPEPKPPLKEVIVPNSIKVPTRPAMPPGQARGGVRRS